ncbi:C2 and GRAM domain-containing protein At1g03370-like [Zingiber officinale]|uniref:C2 and GRAM domain-containing protein At1g03370-like n=1 Tax=Zingiber officinale TaxID=94328 RepID=UPI001C4D82DD|nr:C2 and GRAM domain-containing protein At1g03370-like [Zingiber officinale]
MLDSFPCSEHRILDKLPKGNIYSLLEMKLWVHVIEARNLPVVNLSGTCDPYVRLQLGNHRSKTKVVKKNLNPVWDEKFDFMVGELSEELIITVFNEDKYFNNDVLGKVKVSLLKVLDGENLSLQTHWYQLQSKNKKSKTKKTGEICLAISLSPRNNILDESSITEQVSSFANVASSSESFELIKEAPFYTSSEKVEPSSPSSPPLRLDNTTITKEDKLSAGSFVEVLSQFFLGRNTDSLVLADRKDLGSPEQSQSAPAETEICADPSSNEPCENNFSSLLETVATKDNGTGMPGKLPGGVLLDQSYDIAPVDLNNLLFSPDSNFGDSVAEVQGTTDLKKESWRLINDESSLKRVITYTKAASKLIKSVRATEEQTYLKADGKQFAILASVSIPDVPFGSYFKTEILYCIMPGPQLPSPNQSSNLLISWRINFLQSTMMKGMIESGAKQGLIESFAQFVDILSKHVKPLSLEDSSSKIEENLTVPETKKETGLGLAVHFLQNFAVLLSLFICIYVCAHILIANPSMVHGLELVGLDLPDSLTEFLVSAVLIIQGQYVLKVIGRFLRAREHNRNDCSVKSQGDGWLLTVALIEASNIAAAYSFGSSDSYVVFKCNGKTKTSSIKFQTTNPVWNEVFEFDPMDDPPSRMEVVVYDFDGPSEDAISLGHAEVNFVKSNLSKLADIWIPLQGNLAQACQSKLHLRIFLNNSTSNEVVRQYLTKMEKEVGKKINLRSPQTNSSFQKLFGLPQEEFLINDFSCHLKRKMLLQGRLFLSARVVGFSANIFGHKTKFFILWDDIDDIQVAPPSLANVGIPSLIIILSEGRGMDAKHGAKEVDHDGRLKFHFQSFVSFNVASRTIMALWKARSLSPEQKMQLAQNESEAKEETGSFLGSEDVKMIEVFSDGLPLAASSVVDLFGGLLEPKIMQKVGCIDYLTTPWQSVKPDVHQRRISYKVDKNLSCFTGEVTGTQKKYPLSDGSGWVIEESISLQPQEHQLCAYLSLLLKYQIQDVSSVPKACYVQVTLGISLLKGTKQKRKITKSLTSDASLRLKDMFCQFEIELLTGDQII